MPPLDPSLVPFWLSTTMHGQSIVFLGGQAGTSEGRPVFPPAAILAVTSASADIAYVEGADYAVDRAAGRIVRLGGSRIPLVSRDAVASADGALTHDRTVAVSSPHAAAPDPWRPPASAGTLPRVSTLLRRREPLT